MKIYDISQELFGCAVYPGDERPEHRFAMRISDGKICNLTELSMCAHNGTHIDAPFHFYQDGKTVDEIPLGAVVGKCFVALADGEISAESASEILRKAKKADVESAKRILIKGHATVTLEAAKVFAAQGVLLVGNESQTVGPEDAPSAVHYELLKAEVVLLEGIRLAGVAEGVYFLNAAPLNLGGCDGAPCRAVLLENTQP